MPAVGLVSDIRPVPGDPNMRRIRVDGRTVATMRAADVAAIRVRVGQQWTKSLAARVSEEAAANKARRDAMRFLSGRAYSEHELTQRLIKRGHSMAIVQNIVKEAHRDGWLNDRRYAADIVRSTIRKGPAGRRLLKSKLQQRGLTDEVIDETTSSALLRDQQGRAVDFARGRLAKMGRIPPVTAARRISALLGRRGFDEDTIASALASLRLDVGSEES